LVPLHLRTTVAVVIVVLGCLVWLRTTTFSRSLLRSRCALFRRLHTRWLFGLLPLLHCPTRTRASPPPLPPTAFHPLRGAPRRLTTTEGRNYRRTQDPTFGCFTRVTGLPPRTYRTLTPPTTLHLHHSVWRFGLNGRAFAHTNHVTVWFAWIFLPRHVCYLFTVLCAPRRFGRYRAVGPHRNDIHLRLTTPRISPTPGGLPVFYALLHTLHFPFLVCCRYAVLPHHTFTFAWICLVLLWLPLRRSPFTFTYVAARCGHAYVPPAFYAPHTISRIYGWITSLYALLFDPAHAPNGGFFCYAHCYALAAAHCALRLRFP